MSKQKISRADRALLGQLSQTFQKFAGTSGEVDEATLKRMLKIEDPALARRFFALIDSDGSGGVDEKEFLGSLQTIMGGRDRDKLQFIFRLYDTENKGYILRSEFTDLIRMGLNEHNLEFTPSQINDLAWIMFRQADADGNGSISFSEFAKVLRRHPNTQESLTLDIAHWISPASPRRRRGKKRRIHKAPLYKRIYRGIQNGTPALLLLAAYLAINGYLFYNAMVTTKAAGANIYVQIARGCGAALNFNGALILVPVMRNWMTWLRQSIWGRILPIDHGIDFHRHIANLMMVLALVHTAAHLMNYSLGKTPILDQLLISKAGLSGLILLGVFAVMWLLARDFVRRSGHFEIFSVSHGLYIGWFGLMLWHGPRFWMWAAPVLAGYLIERYFRAKKRKLRTHIEEVKCYSSGVTQLTMQRPADFNYQPGDYIFLRIPKVSRFEWHPYTISSSPEEHDTFSVHVRSLGNWSRAVYRAFEHAHEQRSFRPVPVIVDGPYGTPSTDIFRSSHAILIGAGIGATPFASILKTIHLRARKGVRMNLKKVHFIWLNRGQHSFEWFLEILGGLQARPTKNPIEVSIYMTDVNPNMKSITLGLAMDYLFAESNTDVVTGLRSRTQLGHPDWSKVFSDLSKKYPKQRVNVFFCGPPGLAKKIRPFCRRSGFRFRKENF